MDWLSYMYHNARLLHVLTLFNGGGRSQWSKNKPHPFLDSFIRLRLARRTHPVSRLAGNYFGSKTGFRVQPWSNPGQTLVTLVKPWSNPGRLVFARVGVCVGALLAPRAGCVGGLRVAPLCGPLRRAKGPLCGLH